MHFALGPPTYDCLHRTTTHAKQINDRAHLGAGGLHTDTRRCCTHGVVSHAHTRASTRARSSRLCTASVHCERAPPWDIMGRGRACARVPRARAWRISLCAAPGPAQNTRYSVLASVLIDPTLPC